MGKRKYNLYSCIVCGEGIWWPDQEAQTDLPPACNHHTYEEVWKAIEQEDAETATANAKALRNAPGANK